MLQWIARSGAQWWELPNTYGPWQSVYARFAKSRDDGTLEKVFRALSADADMEKLSIDSTCIKVHESANGGREQRIRRGRPCSPAGVSFHTGGYQEQVSYCSF